MLQYDHMLGGGNFPTQCNFEWVKDKNLGGTYSDVFENVAICSSKTKDRRTPRGGGWGLLKGRRTQILEKHIATFLKMLYVSPKFSGLYSGCSLITIAMFSKNVTVNKK